MIIGPLEVRSSLTLLLAFIAAAVVIALLWRGRNVLSRSTVLLFTIAMILLTIAAGDVRMALPRSGEIVVMVDCSPSTRGAVYRDRKALDARVSQLLGSRSFRLVAFGEKSAELPAGDRLADLPANKSVFDPPATADAIVLLSDGQFALPATAPPTFAVIDGGLLDARDAALIDATIRDGRADVTVSNRQPGRSLSIDGGTAVEMPAQGVFAQQSALKPDANGVHRAVLSPGDAWPENDLLTFAPIDPQQRPRWWIGSNAPAGWQAMSPAAVPTDAAAFLAPSVIALNNVSADELSPAAIDRLQQYTRDLGGSLLIIGGDHAFSLGGYSGTMLEDLSPLSSDPPTPATQWMLLTDASGSMAGGNRWAAASGALASAVRELPPADSVSVGSFAGDVTWWATGVTVRKAKSLTFPPSNVAPSGPTNLQLVLGNLVDQTRGDGPKELLILTDGEASLEGLPELTRAIREKQIRLHVLAIGTGSALPALKQVATATGGTYAVALDATQWLAGVRSLVRGAMPDRLIENPIEVRFSQALKRLPSRRPAMVNRTWAKADADVLATAVPGLDNVDVPAAARLRVGSGWVGVIAFAPEAAELATFANLLGRSPGDPRYAVDWSAASRGKVRVDANDNGKYVNGLSFDLRQTSMQGVSLLVAFSQNAPGHYEADLPTSAEPRLVTVWLDGYEIARATLVGRYAPEFDAIGLNESALRTLAERTGGRVIPPDEKTPIDFPRRWDKTSITPYAAILAAGMIAAGLVQWKRK